MLAFFLKILKSFRRNLRDFSVNDSLGVCTLPVVKNVSVEFVREGVLSCVLLYCTRYVGLW